MVSSLFSFCSVPASLGSQLIFTLAIDHRLTEAVARFVSVSFCRFVSFRFVVFHFLSFRPLYYLGTFSRLWYLYNTLSGIQRPGRGWHFGVAFRATGVAARSYKGLRARGVQHPDLYSGGRAAERARARHCDAHQQGEAKKILERGEVPQRAVCSFVLRAVSMVIM